MIFCTLVPSGYFKYSNIFYNELSKTVSMRKKYGKLLIVIQQYIMKKKGGDR